MEVRREEDSIGGVTLLLVLLLLGPPAAAQSPKLKDSNLRNIELCSGRDRASLEPRINGCTSLIDSGQGTPAVLATAYNNRGNAYATKGDYERAIHDCDQSI